MFHLQDDVLEVRHNSLELAFKEQVALAYTTDLQIDEDLSALNQRCDCSRRSIDVVEGTQPAMMDQMSEFPPLHQYSSSNDHTFDSRRTSPRQS